MDTLQAIGLFETHHPVATVRVIKPHKAGFLIIAHHDDEKPFPYKLHFTEDGENASLMDVAGNRMVLEEVINRLTAPQKEAA